MPKTHSTPSHISAEQGEVHMDGPDGVSVSLTPEAAADLRSSLHGANMAAGQKIEKERLEDEAAARRSTAADAAATKA